MSDLPKLALSIRQPWAWAICHAGKDIENRSWQTKYRGLICIHAAKGMTGMEFDNAAGYMGGIGVHPPRGLSLPRGGIVGVAEIVDCIGGGSKSPWFFGPYGFVLANARPVDFIPVKGALHFFEWRKNLAKVQS